MDAKDFVFVILIAVSLSAVCGLRAFLPLAAVSVLGWTGHLTLSPSFAWLAQDYVALALGLAAVLEICADKFPVLDNALDAAGLVIKPAAGAILASSMISGVDPLLSLALGVIVGGGVAGVTHVAKSQLRLFSTALTGGLGNPVLSTAEDATAVAGTALGLVAPVLSGIVALAVIVWLVRRMMRRRRELQESPI
jgi:hypothetical protein